MLNGRKEAYEYYVSWINVNKDISKSVRAEPCTQLIKVRHWGARQGAGYSVGYLKC